MVGGREGDRGVVRVGDPVVDPLVALAEAFAAGRPVALAGAFAAGRRGAVAAIIEVVAIRTEEDSSVR